MLPVHRIAITVALLFGMILVAPAAVSADNGPEEIINATDNDDFGDGGAANFSVEEEETDDKIIWHVNTTANGGELVNNDSLHIYIDDEDKVGLDDETVDSPRWGDFFDGLNPIAADYRVRVSDSGTSQREVVEEHISDVSYDEVGKVNTTDSDELDNGTKITLEKEDIGTPDSFEYKFAYIAAPGEFDIDNNEFRWAPDRSQPFEDGEATLTRTSIQATVSFNGGDITPEADNVEFTLDNDTADDGSPVESEVVDITEATNSITTNIRYDPEDFGGDAELTVETDGDEKYPFERDGLNNSIEIGSLSNGANFTVEISRIEAAIGFGREREGDEEVVGSFDLENNSEETSEVNFTHNGEGKFKQNYTVNPNNFDNGEVILDIDTIAGENYDFSAEKDDLDFSAAEVAFNASQLDYEFGFELLGQGGFGGYDDTNPDLVDDNDNGFTVQVNLSADEAGDVNDSVQQIVHVAEFNESELVAQPINESDLDTASRNVNADLIEVNNSAGEIKINVFSGDTSENILSVANASSEEPFSYDVTFEFADGLDPEELDQEPDAVVTELEIDPNVTLRNAENETLSVLADSTSIDIENSKTVVEEDEITHLTEGGDMVGSPIKYEIDVDTNDGNLSRATLFDDEGVKLTSEELSGSSDNVVLKANPFESDDNTAEADGYVQTGEFDIGITDGQNRVIYNATDDMVDEDQEQENVLQTTVYKEYDVTASGQDNVTTEDVLRVAERVPEDPVEELPWDDKVSARADFDNDGEVTSSDLGVITSEWNQADFVDEMNATIDNDPDPSVGVNSKNDINITVTDQRLGDTEFDADSSTKGGNITVREIDDGGDGVGFKNLKEGNDGGLVEGGNQSFEGTSFNSGGHGDTVTVTFSLTNNIDDPVPEANEETITIELIGATGEKVNATFDNSSAAKTNLTINEYELNGSGDGDFGNATGVESILIEVENVTGDNDVNFSDVDDIEQSELSGANVSGVGGNDEGDLVVRVDNMRLNESESLTINTTNNSTKLPDVNADNVDITVTLTGVDTATPSAVEREDDVANTSVTKESELEIDRGS